SSRCAQGIAAGFQCWDDERELLPRRPESPPKRRGSSGPSLRIPQRHARVLQRHPSNASLGFARIKNLPHLGGRGKIRRDQIALRLVKIGMWKTTLDECRLAEIVISKMARPANRRREVGAGLMHKQGREEERV